MTGVGGRARRIPPEILRGLVPWVARPPLSPPGEPIILVGKAITSLLPYDDPSAFLREVRLYPDGKIAEGVHIVDPAWCQGHTAGLPLLPGSVLGDLLYLTFAVLLRHSPLLDADAFAGRLGVRARDEDFRYRRRILPESEVIVGVELLGRRGDLLAAHGWATVAGETVFEARRCWIGLTPRAQSAVGATEEPGRGGK